MPIESQHRQRRSPWPSPHDLRSITSYRVEYNPSSIQAGDPNNPRPADPIIREEPARPRAHRAIRSSVKTDRQDVTGKLPRAGLRHPGRAAPAGRRLRLQPRGGQEVRPADRRAPARGRGRVQVSTGDPPRQPGHVGPVDQLRDPRAGDHRRGRTGVPSPRRSTT